MRAEGGGGVGTILVIYLEGGRSEINNPWIGLCFVRVAVACAVLKRTSGFDLYVENCSKVFEVCDSTYLLPLYLDLPLTATSAELDTVVYKTRWLLLKEANVRAAAFLSQVNHKVMFV